MISYKLASFLIVNCVTIHSRPRQTSTVAVFVTNQLSLIDYYYYYYYKQNPWLCDSLSLFPPDLFAGGLHQYEWGSRVGNKLIMQYIRIPLSIAQDVAT